MARVSFRRYAASSSSRPGLFATLGTRMVAGRDLTWTDTYQKRPVAIISENFAREYWHDANGALGKRIRVANTDDWREIVGVAQDVHDDGVDKAAPSSVYWPVMLDNFEGQKQKLRRGVAFHHSQSARRLANLHERGSAAGLVGQSRCAAGGCFHTRRALHEIHGADFLYSGDALRRGRHGSAAGDRRNLRSHLVFGVAADARDRHSHGAGCAAGDADRDVCAPGIVADRHRRRHAAWSSPSSPCA